MPNSFVYDPHPEPDDGDRENYSPFQLSILAEIKGLKKILVAYPKVYYARRWQEIMCDTTISEYDRRWAIGQLQTWCEQAAAGVAAQYAVSTGAFPF